MRRELSIIYDMRIAAEVINYDKKYFCCKKLFAAVIQRAILDGIAIEYFITHQNNDGNKKRYLRLNTTRIYARKWFNSSNSNLKYFCDHLNWNLDEIVKMANDIFDECDKGILKTTKFSELI